MNYYWMGVAFLAGMFFMAAIIAFAQEFTRDVADLDEDRPIARHP